jgi:hypothetical protein
MQSTKEGERVGCGERYGPGYRDNLNGKVIIQPLVFQRKVTFSRPLDGLLQSNGITCTLFMYNKVHY